MHELSSRNAIEEPEPEISSSKKLGAVQRRPIDVATQPLITTGSFPGEDCFPLVVKAVEPRLSAADWAINSRQFVEDNLLKFGAVLFRDYSLHRLEDFAQFAKALIGELIPYTERSSPRHQVAPNIYTSTDYPAAQSIFLHSENSYQNTWPMRICFFCVTPAQEGGETPIASNRKISARIDPEIRDRFLRKKVMYVRNFGDGFGLTLEDVFQTTDRNVVEEHCRRAGIEAEWKSGHRLRTRAVRPAFETHPQTGELIWFNHATFFNVSTLEPAVREALLAEFGEDDLPTNTYYGDGTPIEPSVLDQLREIYWQEAVTFPWRKGDLLVLDNMLAAHGRVPFAGPRQILVSMSQPWSRTS